MGKQPSPGDNPHKALSSCDSPPLVLEPKKPLEWEVKHLHKTQVQGIIHRHPQAAVGIVLLVFPWLTIASCFHMYQIFDLSLMLALCSLRLSHAWAESVVVVFVPEKGV